MSNESFPRVNGYIANLLKYKKDLRNIFVKLESVLKEKDEMIHAKIQIQKDVHNLRVDLMLIRQVANILQEEREETNNCMHILQTSYSHLLEIIGLLDDDRTKNMLRFKILSKQNEVQDKLNLIEELQKSDLECKASMERRRIVKDFRKCQLILKETEEECLNMKLENQQLHHQWKIKIERATQQRNKKIISLVELCKQITDNHAILQFKVPNTYISSMNRREHTNRGKVLRGKSGPLALQSALEFIRKYPEDHCAVAEKLNIENNIKDMTPPLRSILVVNRPQEGSNETISPTKQVHFAPLPSPMHVDESSDMSLENVIQKLDQHPLAPNTLIPKSSELHKDNMPIVNVLPERAIVKRVEVLPRLNFPLENASNAFAAPDSPNNSMTNLSFKNFFPSNDSVQEDDSVEKIEDAGCQSTDDSESNVNDSNTLNFSTQTGVGNENFFLNFCDENSRSYEL